MGRFLSLDPLAAEFPEWSDYNYVLGNPVMLIDPDGKAPKWKPVIEGEGYTGGLGTNWTLVKEEGDDLESLYEFFGSKERTEQYLGSKKNMESTIADMKVGASLSMSKTDVFSEGMTDYLVFQYGDKSSISAFQNPRCHTAALCGTRGQNMFDEKLSGMTEDSRNKIVKKQYNQIERKNNSKFKFEDQGSFGSSILTFPDHTAVYFGTSQDGTQYFFSKNNSLKFSIDTQDQLRGTFGKVLGAYTIKKEYKNTLITKKDIDEGNND